MDVGRFTHLVWHWMTRNAEKASDVAALEARLWRPPPGVAGTGPWSADAENAAFAALKAGLSG